MTDRTTPLLAGLTAAQREAVTVEASPLCLLAGAGSGKTRVLTRRIAWRVATGSADAGHVLALTFTRKAAGELRSRLSDLGVRERVAAGTFHGLAYAQLRRRWADRGEPAPGLLERKAGLLSRLLGQRGGAARHDPAAVVRDLAAEIEWAKARMIGPDAYARTARASRRRPALPLEEIADLYDRYESAKHRRRVVDFDDLLLQCAEALETDPEFAAGQRWRWRHFFVDEFQDVNPAQFRLLSGWLGGRFDVCVVGDPNQAIYSWNGADPALLVRFTDRFPAATVLRLDDNFRSSPQIVGVASAVLGSGAAVAGAGASAGASSLRSDAAGAPRPQRPDGPVPTVRSFPSEQEEAAGIARAIRRARRPNTSWSRIAVLTRTNAQLTVIHAALRAAAVPSRIAGGAPLAGHPEVRAIIERLSGVPAGVPFLSAVNDAAGVGWAAPSPPAGEASSPPAGGAPEDVGRVVRRLAGEYADLDPNPTADGFATWLAASMAEDAPAAAGDAVELTTFHRAKGLEWPVVFLAGLEQGLVPIGHATTLAAEAEERRLLYVAMTRAETELHCSWAERRTFGARTVGREPSPWLDTIEAACRAVAEDGRADASVVRRLLAEQRATLDGPPAMSRTRGSSPRVLRPAAALEARADPAILADLKAWRASQAKLSGVPAYVIFHDATLAALAEARPRSSEELLGLPGLGPVKAARYGDDLLALVARHEASA